MWQHCCWGLGDKPNQSRKQGKKTTPGQAITSLENKENKENADPIPGSSSHQNTKVHQDCDSKDSD